MIDKDDSELKILEQLTTKNVNIRLLIEYFESVESRRTDFQKFKDKFNIGSTRSKGRVESLKFVTLLKKLETRFPDYQSPVPTDKLSDNEKMELMLANARKFLSLIERG